MKLTLPEKSELKLQAPSSESMDFALPATAYLDQSQFELEKRRIFWKDWFCVGRSSRLVRAGDYIEVSIAGERILLIRGEDRKVRGFYNVCRHRGSRLCGVPLSEASSSIDVEQTGRFRGAIVCPYHAWTYELDGRLRRAPFFHGIDEANRQDYGLNGVGLVNWRGFLWVNLSELPGNSEVLQANFKKQLPRGVGNLANYPLEDLLCGARLVYDVKANWKVLAENYNECYHCAPVHPELCKIVPAFKDAGGSNLDWNEGIPHREGAWTFSSSGQSNRAPFPGLSSKEKSHHKGEIVFPNLWLSLAAEHVAAFILWPVSPGETKVSCEFLFHKDEIATPGFDPNDVTEFWDTINRQDWRICESVQDGMTSRSFHAGIMAPMENASMDVRRYVEARLDADID